METVNTLDSKKKKKNSPLFMALMSVGYELVVILFGYLLLHALVFGMYRIRDNAMEPAVKEGDLVIFYRLDKEYRVDDPITLQADGTIMIRRVAGVAGDTIDFKDGVLIRNGVPQAEKGVYEKTEQFTEGPEFPLTVPDGFVFVMGDAREHSLDSRIFGCVKISDTYGTVVTVFRRRNI